jgi:hypothetical protein
MPIISINDLENKSYRVTVTMGGGIMENVVVTADGLYSLYYISNGKSLNRTGKIAGVIQNLAIPKNNYILFDWSEDNSNRRERIYFYQIQYIKDVTPNNAYQIALKHGFVGSESDWLESMRGYPGKDNYEIAVECGFEGTREEWLESIRGAQGFSAYEVAVRAGFNGTEKEWLESLNGKSAYEVAVENGFEGTEEEWLLHIGDTTKLQDEIERIKESLTWKTDLEDDE